MKAKGAPEKIYIRKEVSSKGNEFVGCTWHEKESEFYREHDIEYTRTDAFIEKACAFIEERLVFQDKKWYTGKDKSVKDQVIEDFRKYMKESEYAVYI